MTNKPKISDEARKLAKKIERFHLDIYYTSDSSIDEPEIMIQSLLNAERDKVRRESLEEAARIVERYRESVLLKSSSIALPQIASIREAAAKGLQDVSEAIRSLSNPTDEVK